MHNSRVVLANLQLNAYDYAIAFCACIRLIETKRSQRQECIVSVIETPRI